ncbi:HAD-IIIC family phosphatase [Salinarimonas soli]|uniref:HAD-IIIC family phosphatase n=1 Tax=Salinarimonas soli TaxID=1638099 RepID=A0A5B2V4L4_9HYPH|nr:HAD-IIIC family phosphatase [Salinarimonas soli]KAA2233445.1 HAD-IIIC family phosphatase [Salinarimonas soli]
MTSSPALLRGPEAGLPAEGGGQAAPPPIAGGPQEALRAARTAYKEGRPGDTTRLLFDVVDCGESYLEWQAAAALAVRMAGEGHRPPCRRSVRLWIGNSYTVGQFTPLLRLAAWRNGVDLEIGEGTYGQFRQEILDPGSGLYAFEPDIVLLAVHAGDVPFGEFSSDPAGEVDAEARSWAALLRTLTERRAVRVVLHNFATPAESCFGNLTESLPGSRTSMLRALNRRIVEEAPETTAVVDVDRASAVFGKSRWFDPKYWHLSRQACSLAALPMLAKQTSAVIAASVGLSKKCIAVDFDNTLWGGVIGEDGVGGIRIGGGDAEGEAFAQFQATLKALKERGILLAACTKNNPADAREPFLKRPEMILKLEDFAAFAANWDRKSDNLVRLAQELNIGLDAIVFVDDNPAEREIIRQLVPEVEVLDLPADPSGYARALAGCTFFEVTAITAEDAERTRLYRARADAQNLRADAGTVEDFYRSLAMTAHVRPVDDASSARVVQLLSKSNQFNLTTKRYGPAEVAALRADPDYHLLAASLRDRFTDHGLVCVMGCRVVGDVLEIDVWAMSCRVIGRTLESFMLAEAVGLARESGCRTLRGLYLPTAKNGMVADLYPRLGFVPAVADEASEGIFTLDVATWAAGQAFIEAGF